MRNQTPVLTPITTHSTVLPTPSTVHSIPWGTGWLTTHIQTHMFTMYQWRSPQQNMTN